MVPEGAGLFIAAATCVCLMVSCGSPAGEWHVESDHQYRLLATPTGNRAGFRAVRPARSGVSAANNVPEQAFVANRHLMHGSGVAIGDIDGDGRPDIYVARLNQPNVLYRNEGGWRFQDVTEEAGAALDGRASTGAALADIDGDGDLDLLVTMLSGPGAVLRNDGAGRFTDFTRESGVASPLGGTTMALADIDGDHDLDLYIGRYKRIAIRDSLPADAITWEQVMQDSTYAVKAAFAEHYEFKSSGSKVLRIELGEPDGLFLNDGTGRYSPVPWTGGAFLDAKGLPLAKVPRDWTLTARFHDVNADGHVDLYVCSDFEGEDALWLGDGAGRFRLAPPEALRKFSNATMSVDFSDIDRDGHMDFFLTDMLSQSHIRRQRQRNTRIPIPIPIGDLESRPQEMQNTLFVGRGDGTFVEMANLAGVAASDWSWAVSFLDVDLDGYEDLLITTGHAFDIQDMDAQATEQRRLAQVRGHAEARALLLDFPRLALPNVAFRNRGDRTFEIMPNGWGLGPVPDVSHGMAQGDLDGDGDQDVVINRLNDVVALYENTASAPRIAVQLQGPPGNTHGVGATIALRCLGLAVQRKEVSAAGQYVSSSQMLATFAATDQPCGIDVTWPDGTATTVAHARSGRHYEVAYQSGGPRIERPAVAPGPFALAQTLPVHSETPYDDFARQPLLPRRLSQRGPAVAAADLDADGDEDLTMGAGRGGELQTFRNDDGAMTLAGAAPPLQGDITGIVVLPGDADELKILAGVSNYERTPETAGDSSYIQEFRVTTAGVPLVGTRLPFGADTPGPLALADMDGDQDLDLFGGGSFRPGAYPMAASSSVYRNEDGAFTYDRALSRPFDRIGMVSAAVFGDMDADGDADAVLALDWGPVRVFLFEDGTFVDHTRALGLSAYTGWWNGVALGDFDGDGMLDIAASNWGWNLRYGSHRPVRLHYGDVDANGIVDLFETFYEPSLDAYVPARQAGDLLAAVPLLLHSFGSHAAFATASMPAMLGSAWSRLNHVETSTLGAAVFLNRETYFDARMLPQAAQYTATTGMAVADINADGHEDLVLGQNYFALPAVTPRLDGGRGLWLAGDGQGGFMPMPLSGLAAYGEGRAVSTADWDRDGRSDVLLTQNGAAALLYRNNSENVGLRVRLAGPPANPWGIGATVRVGYDDGSLGPARPVTAGSGYWSQQAPVLVMGRRLAVKSVRVRWPDGKEATVAVAPGAQEIVLAYPGR